MQTFNCCSNYDVVSSLYATIISARLINSISKEIYLVLLLSLSTHQKICLQYCRLREESEALCWRTRIYPPRKACQTRHQQQDLHLVGLDITDNKIQTMPWAAILEKVVQLQSLQQLCVVKDLSAHDVVMQLMQKENYLIGMLNKGVLAFPISKWVPGAGPTVKSGSKGKCRRLILTKTLEWTLNWCILQSMFDRTQWSWKV
nr:autophagy-related protein 9-like isoform X2 [Ziziphus jujuba var. spinosa]XP_048325232.1 autophagy-related protein 9-like isoform X2 [Ziziphus jujuba var. spinosa]XP_048325235.1 autophagy-related protein 9-like isoform X2 [Ziziphus jujuba var. spinosa]